MAERAEREIPDMSLEIDKALHYADYLRDEIGKATVADNGHVLLSSNQVEAYGWMLCDIGNFLHVMGEALYGMKTTGVRNAKAERQNSSEVEPANDKTGGSLCIVEIEDVTDKLAVLCSALAHEADKVGTPAATPLNHSDAHGLLMLALEAHVTLHKQVYGMTPAEMAAKTA